MPVVQTENRYSNFLIANCSLCIFNLYYGFGTWHDCRQRVLFLAVPLFCYLAGVLMHSLDGLWFWRGLAYLAVFHFVRQQYGFMRIYSHNESPPYWSKVVDTVTIYAATLYPILWWHLTPDRNFNWFVDGDF